MVWMNATERRDCHIHPSSTARLHDETLVWSRPDRSTVRCGCVHHQRRGSQGRHRRQSLWPGGGGGGHRAARLKCYDLCVFTMVLVWSKLTVTQRSTIPTSAQFPNFQSVFTGALLFKAIGQVRGRCRADASNASRDLW